MESPSTAGRNSIFNRRQLVALWAGLAVFSLSALFPPWQQHVALFPRNDFIEYPLGRHAWWSPPEEWRRVLSETRSDILGPPPRNRFLSMEPRSDSVQVLVESAHVYRAQLFVELAVVALLTGGLVRTLHRRRS